MLEGLHLTSTLGIGQGKMEQVHLKIETKVVCFNWEYSRSMFQSAAVTSSHLGFHWCWSQNYRQKKSIM